MKSGKPILFCTLLILATANASENFLKKCDLAKTLVDNYKITKLLLPSWICLIEAESNFDTNKVVPYSPIVGTHPTPYKSFGLFQLNSKDHCGLTEAIGYCKVRCKELATSDITKAVNCAQSVWNANGFKVWKGWEKKCKDIKNLPSLNECFSRSDAIAG